MYSKMKVPKKSGGTSKMKGSVKTMFKDRVCTTGR